MNPYIKSLGSTDIMSGSEEKTQTVSPDHGATGETVTSVPLAEAELTRELKAKWLQFLKQKKEEEEIDKLVSDLSKEYRNEPIPKIDPQILGPPCLVFDEDGYRVPPDCPRLKGSGICENVSEKAADKGAAPPVKNNEVKEAEETSKESKATDTGDEEGRRKREAEVVYPKRALTFLVVLVSVLSIILIIIGIIIISLIFAL